MSMVLARRKGRIRSGGTSAIQGKGFAQDAGEAGRRRQGAEIVRGDPAHVDRFRACLRLSRAPTRRMRAHDEVVAHTPSLLSRSITSA